MGGGSWRARTATTRTRVPQIRLVWGWCCPRSSTPTPTAARSSVDSCTEARAHRRSRASTSTPICAGGGSAALRTEAVPSRRAPAGLSTAASARRSRSGRTRAGSCTCSPITAPCTGWRRRKPSSTPGHLSGNLYPEVAMQTRIRSLALAALATALFAAPGLAKGPPWISIELPVNPYDQSMRGAFLLVHAFHHQPPTGFIVTGTAEGIVNGERRSLKLAFTETSREGVYALKRSWPEEGTWTLVITANQGPGDGATAVVDLGADGAVAAIRVPTMQRGAWTVPAPVSLADIDASLRTRAAALARRA